MIRVVWKLLASTVLASVLAGWNVAMRTQFIVKSDAKGAHYCCIDIPRNV